MTLTEILTQMINSEYGWSVAGQFEDTFNGSESFEDQNENALKYINSMLKDILDDDDSAFSNSAKQEIIVYQRELQEYLEGKMADGGIMAKGGDIKNQYKDSGSRFNKNRSSKDIWESWSDNQRSHFLSDHSHKITNSLKYVYLNFSDLPIQVKDALKEHILEGQYADGGMMAKGGVPRQRKYDDGGMMTMAMGGYDDFGYHKINKEVTLKNGEKIYLTKGRYYYSNELGDGRISGVYYESKDRLISADEIMFPLDKMALGGLFGDSRYNYGRSWTLDHKRHNKGESYEIPLNKRKRKY
jgi:hypothetical protein